MNKKDSEKDQEKKKALQESDNKFRSYIENAPDGVFVADENGRYLEVNTASERITGYSKEELLSMSINQLFPPEGIEEGIRHFTEVRNTGRASGELEFLHKNGSKRWWLVDAVKLSETRYLGFTKDITKRKQTEEALLLSEAAVKNKLKAITEPDGDITTLELSDIIDTEALQDIMDIFYNLTGMLGAVLDVSGKVLVAVGWQDICTKFHRCNPDTLKNCIESDTILTKGVPEGTFQSYHCKNNMWDTVTPLIVGGRHVGNLFMGQYFLEGEEPDVEQFREQARKYGFDEEEYLAALDRVPRFSEEAVNEGMQFYSKLAGIISSLSYSSIKQSRMLAERKQAEEALRASEEMMRSSQSVAHISSYSTNLNLNEFDKSVWVTSPEFYKIFGIDKTYPHTIEGWANFIHPDYRKEISDYHENVVKEKGSFNREYKIIRINDGAERWVHGTGELEFDEKGTPIRMHGAIQDITESKNAGLALAAEKERLAVTLRSIGDGVITTDTEGHVVTLNKVAEALTGWSSNDAIGHPLPEVFNIINENTREQCENPVEKVLATGSIIELENHTCLIAKDGREIVIADSGAPIRNNESQIIGVVLVFRDMTEKQKLEDAFQNSQKLESLGILAGGIAHDFNNILGAIFGYTELAMMKTKEENISSYLAKSVNNIDRARALTEQLLTFAKGGAPIKNVEYLFPFIQETTQFALSGSSVSSRFQIQENLWASYFDKNKIGQVIDNLTINAQQAMPMGGTILVSAINISLSENEHITLPGGNYVKLSIKDQGIGIPKEFLKNIFAPYYSTKPNGHGLGLATSFSIISRHNGCIEVESKPGKGSTFHIYLPAVLNPVASKAGKSIDMHNGSGTFLVMDDEETIREIMKELLESFGYTVVLKENGKDAVDFVEIETKANRKLAGMIFDLTIPGGMGGKEAIQEIRKICSETPAFVASGYSEDPVIANPEEYGFSASICKPFMMDELSEMLEKHMKGK
ncbi:PAS domain S-box protein [Oceanispirochaeta sp.]|jgi:PAS domain S-box-containing protein|uniref:PAS domain S-box protein n=1 Tax=Oceanispirochaeta sp. TaxID=2035350 RepID=UPI00262CAB1B|nr:PAS domain S-box protein [Oceanispirochaeta sp.]MDA3959081.1 PAS domain S-box protein [Oceanispirochaeta sp.]